MAKITGSEALLAQRFALALVKKGRLLVHNHLLGRLLGRPFFVSRKTATTILTNGERIQLIFESETNLSPPRHGKFQFMADTDRRPVTLAVATWEYLDQLSKLGTHGTSVPDVAKTLIEEGIRQAIKDGFLKRKSSG